VPLVKQDDSCLLNQCYHRESHSLGARHEPSFFQWYPDPFMLGELEFFHGCQGLDLGVEQRYLPDDAATRDWAAELAQRFKAGDVVLLNGPLGAGKTTWVRGLLAGLGYLGGVRSPTFNLIQTFETVPPVMHADLYRVKSFEGIGLEDYLDTHLCLIEWPDRAAGLVDPALCWRLNIEFDGDGRRATLLPQS